MNFKSHSVAFDQQFEQVDDEIDDFSAGTKADQNHLLSKMDLENLQHIIIAKKIPLRKALFTAIHTAYSLVRIR